MVRFGVLVLVGCVSHAAPATDDFRALKAERVRAYRDGDRAYFERLLTDDFVSLSAGGKRLDRAAYLASEFAPGQREAVKTETEVSDFHATRTGSTLVLAYEERERTRVGEATLTEHLGRLDVYVWLDGRWRLRTMSAVRIPEAPPRIAVAAEQLAAYAGRYQFGPGLISTVRMAGDKLLEQSTGQPEVELVPCGTDTFYSPPDFEARIEFERDAAGAVTVQRYRSGSQVLRAPRVP